MRRLRSATKVWLLLAALITVYTVPLGFGTGVGAELRVPLGAAIVGGLLVSRALTLYEHS